MNPPLWAVIDTEPVWDPIRPFDHQLASSRQAGAAGLAKHGARGLRGRLPLLPIVQLAMGDSKRSKRRRKTRSAGHLKVLKKARIIEV